MLSKFTHHIPFLASRIPSLSMLRTPAQWKYLYPWFKSQKQNFMLDQGIPWFTYDAINFLKAHVNPGSRVFEFGSGSSTLFWLKHNAECVAVEHDPQWYAVLKARLKPSEKIDLRLVPPDSDAVAKGEHDFANPHEYWSDWSQFSGRTFRTYVQQIDDFADGYFDVVVVDGQARPACILHSYKKVKPGGMLIVDNADVPHYLSRASSYLENFEKYVFYGIGPIYGIMFQTNIYVART